MKIPKSKLYGIVFLFLVGFNGIHSQTINCNSLYWLDEGQVYEFDPVSKKKNKFPINKKEGTTGLAIFHHPKQKDLRTFYSTIEGILVYSDGKYWKSTGHKAPSVNLAGSKEYLYILDGINSKVYRYDGSAEPHLIVEWNENFAGPYDLFCDTEGNFYVMFTLKHKLAKYNPDGKLIQEYEISGLNDQHSGGALAWVNKVLYANVSGSTVQGIIEDGTITFSPAAFLPSTFNDFASCYENVYDAEIFSSVVYKNPVVMDSNRRVTGFKNKTIHLQHSVSLNGLDHFDVHITTSKKNSGLSLFLNNEWILSDWDGKDSEKVKLTFKEGYENNFMIFYLSDKSVKNLVKINLIFTIYGKQYELDLISDGSECGAINFYNTTK